MSAANVSIVRSVYENFMRGDFPAVVSCLDPKVEWVENEEEFLPHRGTHVGPDAVVQGVFAKIPEHFSDFAVIPETMHDAGDVVVVEGRVKGTTVGGRTLDAPVVWVWTVRDGRVVRNVSAHDTDAWRVALTGG
jgi:ketosteroid isomerase-like protein